MTVSTKTAKMLWGRAAALCSMPACRLRLVVDATVFDGEALIGEIGHIFSTSDDGPRANPSLTKEQRDAYENLILLCPNHHAEIDGQASTYSSDDLRKIKANHERWVLDSLPGYDTKRQHDDEVYSEYIDDWSQLSNLENWTAWSSWILNEQPQISHVHDANLEQLRRHLLKRIWPRRHETLERAFINFGRVLEDFHTTFRKHARRPRSDSEWMQTEKFYGITEWNQEEYNRLSKEYELHVGLLQNLMLELTRAANLVCDEVRAIITKDFLLKQGKLSVENGPCDDLSWREIVTEYQEEEKSAPMPYPGLSQFMKDYIKRDRYVSSFTELQR